MPDCTVPAFPPSRVSGETEVILMSVNKDDERVTMSC